MQIGINAFVLRQTHGSKFSHFEGSAQQVANMAADFFHEAKQGYRDGVMLVDVPAAGYFSGVVELTTETELRATFSARREGEKLYKSVEALGAPKLAAKHVELVLYRRDVLLEDDDASTECEWELISINARPTEEPEPLTPRAMARNFLEEKGGTKADYSAREFAESILYWSTRAMCGD
jgi:hypothetical protein